MERTDTYTKIEMALFKGKPEAMQMLTPREMEIKNRMMLCVTKLMDDPFTEDAEIVNFLVHGCAGQADPVSQTQAYRDIGMVKRLVGNVQLAAKSWYRHLIIEGAKKAYEIAIDKGDAKGAAAALDKIGKYTRCDKDDDKFDFSRMTPPSFEPSDDITLIEGLTKIDNLEEKRRMLRRLAKGLPENAPEDAVYEELEAEGGKDGSGEE